MLVQVGAVRTEIAAVRTEIAAVRASLPPISERLDAGAQIERAESEPEER